MSPPLPALVVNADDAGLHAQTDAAILHCFHEGVVRSVSVVANGATTERFVEQALGAGLDLGLHVNLTEGLALSGPINGLTDADGRFRGTADKQGVIRLLAQAAPDVGNEVRAQWERLRALGVRPTHVDGHNHVHLTPPVAPLLEALGTSVYVRTSVEPDGRGPSWFPVAVGDLRPARTLPCFIGHAYAPAPGLDVLRASLERCTGDVEWMVHPGRRPGSPFTDGDARDLEAELLCGAALPALIEERGYRLASFRELLAEAAS